MLIAALSANAGERIEAFGLNWTVPVAADWKVGKEDGAEVLRMLVERPQRQPRRPIQFALAETPPFHQVTVEADVKRLGGSLIVVYAYRDRRWL